MQYQALNDSCCGLFLSIVGEVMNRGTVAAGQKHRREQLTLNVMTLGMNAIGPHIVATADTADEMKARMCH